VSRSGQVVGSSELLVVSDRVDIERLDVQVISGISLSFAGTSSQLPRTLVANVTQHDKLTRKYQVRASPLLLMSTAIMPVQKDIS